MAFVTNDSCVGKRCAVTDMFLVRVRKVEKTKVGTVIGCYLQEYWHPYVHKAFHVEFDDGTKGTFFPKQVKFL